MFILHFIVIGMGSPFLIGCTNKVIIIIIIIIIIIEAKTHTSATKVVLNRTDSDTTDLTYVES